MKLEYNRKGFVNSFLWLKHIFSEIEEAVIWQRSENGSFFTDAFKAWISLYGKISRAVFGIDRWVRNDWDQTVTMEVQGREALINKLLVGLNQGRFIDIQWMDTEEIPLEEEREFTVKYWKMSKTKNWKNDKTEKILNRTTTDKRKIEIWKRRIRLWN